MTKIVEMPINSMVDRVMAMKKVHVNKDDVITDVVTRMWDYINYFNTIGPYVNRVLGQDLNDIIVLNEFKDFIIPASVKMNAADLMCNEMLIYAEVDPDVKPMSYTDYLNTCLTFRSFFKTDLSSDYVKLGELKKSVSWADVSARCTYEVIDDDQTYYVTRMTDSVPFVPLLVNNFIINGWKPTYFNATREDVMSDYMASWLIKF